MAETYIIDYQSLIDRYKDYSNPREKISRLIRKNMLLRVRKGLYIDIENYKNIPYSLEFIANLIYGPSYVSFEYALSYYGLIPEKSNVVTSATLGRSRRYKTPLGIFTYKMVKIEAYYIGIDLVDAPYGSFQIATPTKALADKIVYDANVRFQSVKRMEIYLFDDLRIDKSTFYQTIDKKLLKEIAKAYNTKKLNYLLELLEGENE